MGNLSFLITTQHNPEKYVINWENVNKEKIQDLIKESAIPELQTLNDLAHCWDGIKLVGYMDEPCIEALKEICRNLSPAAEVNPKLFYDVELYGMMSYLEFEPGTENVCVGTYDYLPECDTEDYDELCVRTQRLFKELPERTEGWKVHRLADA
jgi:hypothetical protein